MTSTSLGMDCILKSTPSGQRVQGILGACLEGALEVVHGLDLARHGLRVRDLQRGRPRRVLLRLLVDAVLQELPQLRPATHRSRQQPML